MVCWIFLQERGFLSFFAWAQIAERFLDYESMNKKLRWIDSVKYGTSVPLVSLLN